MREYLSVHIPSNKPLDCNQSWCNFQTGSQGNLKIHIKTYSIDKLYNCIQCYANFDKFIDLEKHCLNEHGKKNPFVCEECDYTCVN